MKLKSILLIMTPLLLLCAGLAAAEDAATPSALSLRDCIAIALTNQADVLIGQNTAKGAKAREIRAKSDYYPQIAAQSSTRLAESGNQRSAGTTGTSLTISQNFYDSGLRETKVSGARAETAQSVYSLERTRQTVAFDVAHNYFSLLRAMRLAEVEDARIKYLEEQLAWVHTRVQVGDAAESDALPVEAKIANARVDQLAARNAVRTAAVQLQHTMGLSPRPEFSIQEFAAPTNTEIHTLDDYAAAALSDRPEIRQTRAGIASAQSSVKSAKIALSPRLEITGQYDRNLSGGESDSLNGVSGKQSLAITGAIVFDLFNGRKNRADYQEARASFSSAEIRAAQVGKDIRSEVQEAYLNLTNARERLAASDLSLKAAQRNFDAQEGRYKQGLAIPLDLLNAQLEVVTAQSNAVQARYDYYTSIAQLEYATGKQEGLFGG